MFTVGSNVVQAEYDALSGVLWLAFTTAIPDAPLVTLVDADLATELPSTHTTTKLPNLVTVTACPVVMTHTEIPNLDVRTELDDD